MKILLIITTIICVLNGTVVGQEWLMSNPCLFTVTPSQLPKYLEEPGEGILLAGIWSAYFLWGAEDPNAFAWYTLGGIYGVGNIRDDEDRAMAASAVFVLPVYNFTRAKMTTSSSERLWTNLGIVGSLFVASKIKTPTGSVYDTQLATAVPWLAYSISDTPSVYFGALEAGTLLFRMRDSFNWSVDGMLLAGAIYNFGFGERLHPKETIAWVNYGVLMATALLDNHTEGSVKLAETKSVEWQPAIAPNYVGVRWYGAIQ
ncbi:hypothetical protein EBR57_10085 [bacterium]|nr:hypothetical protein [bacterium]